MKKLPSVKDLPLENKTVLLRVDYDVPLEEGKIVDTSRIDESLATINYLLQQKAKIILLSHLGRPEGQIKPKFSLKPVVDVISNFQFSIFNEFPISKIKLNEFDGWKINKNLYVMENLRFWPGEENNDLAFAKNLASLGDFYVNDAFACMHRAHASIVGLPHFLPSAFGFDCLEEVEVLSKLKENPQRLVTLILGGAKADKLEVIKKLSDWADNILIGGKLPLLIKESYSNKVAIADLNDVGKDITLEAINKFKEIIAKSGTIIWAGPMGLYEEEAYQEGTKEIAQSIIDSQAFKVIGGGDTEAALTKFNLIEKINFVSSGGGAMLEFLAQETLPGIEAIINNEKSN